MTFKNNRTSLLCYFKLCAAFCSHWVNSNWSYSPEIPNLGQNWRFLELCDLEIWHMTLKNNRAPLQCYFKLSAAFRSHWWIQTGVTVWKCPIWVKIYDFCSLVTLKFDGWPLTNDLQTQWGTSPKHYQAICIISPSYVNSNWSYSPETVKLGCDLCDLDLWPLTLAFCMEITSVTGNNFWKFHDDTMMGTSSKRCDGQMDGRTDRRTEPFIELLGRS